MISIRDIRYFLGQEIHFAAILRTLCALLPGLALYAATREVLYLKLGVITVALWIGAHRVSQSFWLMAGHAVFIGAATIAFYFSFAYPLIFAPLCAAAAFASVYVSRGGSHLRSLGDFTFIPALYVASQLHATDGGAAGSRHAVLAVVAHIPLSVISVTVVLLGWRLWCEWSAAADRSVAGILAAARRAQADVVRTANLVARAAPPALPTYDPLLTASMHGLAVLAAATWVSTTRLAHGEWAIISAAAVVTGEAHSIGARIRDRLIGVSLGTMLGLAVQAHLPQTDTAYAAAVLGLGLASVAFARYVAAFAARCFFVVISAAALGQGPASGLERVETVIAGGAIGLFVSLAVPAAIRLLRPPRRPPPEGADPDQSVPRAKVKT